MVLILLAEVCIEILWTGRLLVIVWGGQIAVEIILSFEAIG